jgi:hypothetical protein
MATVEQLNKEKLPIVKIDQCPEKLFSPHNWIKWIKRFLSWASYST